MTATTPEIDRVCLRLELLSGLMAGPSGLSEAEWLALLAPLPPADARVVVLKVLHGMSEAGIGERLGFSKARASQRWLRALRRLAGSRLVRQLAG